MKRTEIRVLVLASNPINSNRLRLDEEVREIKEGLLRSKYRDNFTFSQSWAVRLRDLRRSMLDYDPHIVHFCGHGAESGLLIEDDNGEATVVEASALEGLFELFKKQVDCVLLNACYSHKQALAINKHINCVMGMKSGIQDKAAIEFAVGFYDALGAGRTFEDAFKFGQNAIQLFNIPQNLIPVLSLRSSLSQIVLGTEIDISSNQDCCKKKILERLLTTQFLNIGLDRCQTFQSKEYVGKSGNKYLIDASFEIDATGINLVILVQCNINPTPVTSDDVMSLSYKLRDIGAHKGLLITSWGFDNNAVEIARSEGIALLIAARGRLNHYLGHSFTLYEHWISDLNIILKKDQLELQIVGLRLHAGNCVSRVERLDINNPANLEDIQLAFLLPSEEEHLEINKQDRFTRLTNSMGKSIPFLSGLSYEGRSMEEIL